jgi:hypothetical protein
MAQNVGRRLEISDCPPYPGELDAVGIQACEQSYRRGFTQGVAAACRAVQKGKTWDDLRSWLDRLMDWRLEYFQRKRKGRRFLPEELV